MEWQLSEGPGPTRRLRVRSRCGGYNVESIIRDDVFAPINGRISASVVCAPLVIGPEFPPGSSAPGVPFQMEGGFEMAKGGIIHTELVRSLICRWALRRRYRRQQA
jgi:hypothetical protein